MRTLIVQPEVKVLEEIDCEERLILKASRAAGSSRDSAEKGLEGSIVRCRSLLRRFPAHLSPFRHSKVQLEIVTDRAVSAELFRHKFVEGESVEFEAVERSSRYVDFSQELPILPSSGDILVPELVQVMGAAYTLKKTLEPDLARRVLPLGTVTRLVCSASLEAWARFYFRRSDKEAVDYEMRRLAKGVAIALADAFPILWREMLGAVVRPDSASWLRDWVRSGPVVTRDMERCLALTGLRFDGKALVGVPWTEAF